MNVTRTATLCVVAAACAAWLAAASAPLDQGSPLPPARPASTVEASSEALAAEIARLGDRLRPTAAPRQPVRNLFHFEAPVRPGTAPMPAAAPVATEIPQPPAPVSLKLIGLAEDAGPNGVVRTAIISGQGQLFLAREGDEVTSRYRVSRISGEVVELAALDGGAPVRLALK
jgi:hypothetical protein